MTLPGSAARPGLMISLGFRVRRNAGPVRDSRSFAGTRSMGASGLGPSGHAIHPYLRGGDVGLGAAALAGQRVGADADHEPTCGQLNGRVDAVAE